MSDPEATRLWTDVQGRLDAEYERSHDGWCCDGRTVRCEFYYPRPSLRREIDPVTGRAGTAEVRKRCRNRPTVHMEQDVLGGLQTAHLCGTHAGFRFSRVQPVTLHRVAALTRGAE